jgi:hypothetical protein
MNNLVKRYCNAANCTFDAVAVSYPTLTPPPYKHIDNQVISCSNTAKDNILALPLGIFCAGV